MIMIFHAAFFVDAVVALVLDDVLLCTYTIGVHIVGVDVLTFVKL